MSFEDILKDIGGFGMYQKLLILSFLPCFALLPWLFMNTTFMSMTPDHWCYVPEVANSNLSFEEKMELIRPPDDPSCSMYDVNYSQILKSGNWNVDTEWPTKTCIYGYEYDQTNYDSTASTYWNMVCDNAHYSSLLVSSTFIGHIIGTPFYGFMADRLGRKPTFVVLASLLAITDIGSVLSPYFELFICLRAVYGTAFSSLYAVSYVIVLELVSPNMRARTNGVATTTWSLGLCLLPLIVWLTRNWVLLSTVTSAASACLIVLSAVLPESPCWLITQERYEEANEVLSKISKMNGKSELETSQLQQKIQTLGDKIKKEKTDEAKYSPLYFFRYPKLRKRFFIIMICWIGNSIPYYGLQINVKNLSGNEFFNFFYVSLIEVPAHLATWLCMERIGRRWCAIGAFAVSAISCIMPVLIPSEDGLVGVIASLCAKAGTSAAFMVLYQQGPELFPTPLRAMGMSMAITVGVGSALVSPFITYMSKYDKNIPFLVFSIMTFLSGLNASLLPETLNRGLPQTVEDVENFEDTQGFFPCSKKSKKDMKFVDNIRTLKISPLVDPFDSTKYKADQQATKNPTCNGELNSVPTKLETLSVSSLPTEVIIR